MGLDIYFYKHRNTNAQTERALKEFYEQFNEQMPASKVRELAEELGVRDRVSVEEHEYTMNGKPTTYTTAYRTDTEEVGYMRKHNHLLPYFNYGDNCSNQPVSRSAIEAFIDDATEVLSHWGEEGFENVANDLIPHEEGFFFGGYDYDDWYRQDLEEDIRIFKDILAETDWNTDEIVMHCWW